MTKRNKITLFLLALLFAAPGIIAYLYFQHPQWLGASTNLGELLNPPVRIAKLDDTKQKWRLVLWNPEACDSACIAQLDKLARVRLALGRRLYEVDQWLISEKESPANEGLLNLLREQDIHFLFLEKQTQDESLILKNKTRVFIANPDGFLILAYDMTAKSASIYHDLKQLLNSTEKKSG